MQDAFADRGFSIIALSQEDKEMDSAVRFLKGWTPEPEFPIVADFNRAVTAPYDRTSAFLIDDKGVVRQVFPMLIHMRATAGSILREIDRLQLSVGGEGTSSGH